MHTDTLNERSRKLVQQIRSEWEILDILRDEGLEFPEEVVRYENISYGAFGDANLTDIYCKKDISGLLPVIVSVHGGGWVYSYKELYKHYCLSLADRGFAVVNFNYRLAPEFPFPAAIEDINRLFVWLLEKGSVYGIDIGKIFVVGDSAGAQMAAQYLTMLTNRAYAELFPFEIPTDLTVRGAALNCGIYDLSYQDDMIKTLLNAYLGENELQYREKTDILGHLTKDFPPAFITTSYYDFLKECATPLYEALKDRGVDCVLREYGNENRKEVEHVFHCNLKLPEAKVCNDETCEFFRSILRTGQ